MRERNADALSLVLLNKLARAILNSELQLTADGPFGVEPPLAEAARRFESEPAPAGFAVSTVSQTGTKGPLLLVQGLRCLLGSPTLSRHH
jgi:hypothetical protein